MIDVEFGQTKLKIYRGKLSQADVDVLVRETDGKLSQELSDGGLDKAGAAPFEQARKAAYASLEGQKLGAGKVLLSEAGELSAKGVIHTVLPPWQNRFHGEKIALERSYQNALVTAIDKRFKTIAFPALGLGERGFPGYEATVIALHTIERVVTLHDRRTDYRAAIDRVEIIVADARDFELYQSVYRAYAHRWDDNRAAS